MLLASSCLLLTVGPGPCRHFVLLYELMEGKADDFIAWHGSRENQPAHERVDVQAALQALLDGQEWAKASRCTQSCIVEPEGHLLDQALLDQALMYWKEIEGLLADCAAQAPLS